jgi:hypothetical protein
VAGPTRQRAAPGFPRSTVAVTTIDIDDIGDIDDINDIKDEAERT